MSRVDVDTQSLVKIRHGLMKLQNVADNGLYNAERALSGIESEIKSAYQRGHSRIFTLESEVARLEKAADAQQAEYDRQVKAAEEAKAQGRPYTLPYYSPDKMREEANVKKKQLNELKAEVENLKKQILSYKASKEVFFDEFSKIASGASGSDGENAVNVLERSITTLDEYVHVNMAADTSATYDNYAAQMQAMNERNAENNRRLREEGIRLSR